MVINAIGLKLLMVKTVAQCLKIEINQKFSPTTKFMYELLAANEGHFSDRNHEQTNRQNRVSIMFCHFAEISVVKLQNGTVQKLVIILNGVISKLNRMVPAK